MEKNTVIGTQIVTEFLKTILLTGRVAKESPVSTFLIAKPEHGKTSVVLESPFSCAVDVSDCTGKGLQEILKYKAEISHIIFNDLTIVTAHSKTVRAYLISIINAMTEEGLRSVAFPGSVEVFQNGKRGIVACCTPSLISDSRTWFNKIGLTSRIVPFHYTYSESLVIRIKALISNNTPDVTPKDFKIPTLAIDVQIPEREAKQILDISNEKAKELGDDTGIRRLKQFRRLAKAHALMHPVKDNWKNPVVNQDDIDFLKRIYPYIDYQKGCIL
jgi:hypothetical protein